MKRASKEDTPELIGGNFKVLFVCLFAHFSDHFKSGECAIVFDHICSHNFPYLDSATFKTIFNWTKSSNNQNHIKASASRLKHS